MKICFICGSLEPGKDGVGDYTRRLAGELIRQGHQSSIISINDSFIDSAQEFFQNDEDVKILSLRIPSVLSSLKKLNLSRNFIEKFQPTWLSLQYVPFSFNVKGLHFGLSNFLVGLSDNAQWHIMFHEYRVDIKSGLNFKMKIWGFLQMLNVKSIFRKLKPQVIHTHSQVYKKCLALDGISSASLPLFSNLSDYNSATSDYDIVKNTKNDFKTIFFGTIYSWDHEKLENVLIAIVKHCKENNLIPSVIFIGKSHYDKQRIIQKFKVYDFLIQDFGEKSILEIIQNLNCSDIGITTTPLLLAQKSGTIAAMKQFNLPVFSIANEWAPFFHYINTPFDGIYDLGKNNFLLSDFLNNGKLPRNYITLEEVSNQFINNLNES